MKDRFRWILCLNDFTWHINTKVGFPVEMSPWIHAVTVSLLTIVSTVKLRLKAWALSFWNGYEGFYCACQCFGKTFIVFRCWKHRALAAYAKPINQLVLHTVIKALFNGKQKTIDRVFNSKKLQNFRNLRLRLSAGCGTRCSKYIGYPCQKRRSNSRNSIFAVQNFSSHYDGSS